LSGVSEIIIDFSLRRRLRAETTPGTWLSREPEEIAENFCLEADAPHLVDVK